MVYDCVSSKHMEITQRSDHIIIFREQIKQTRYSVISLRKLLQFSVDSIGEH